MFHKYRGVQIDKILWHLLEAHNDPRLVKWAERKERKSGGDGERRRSAPH